MGWSFRTLDGAGTFHGMGIQNTGWCWNIPWDGYSEHWMVLEHSMGWAFRTLDGAGTFHGMGIQNTGRCWDIPWDGHYRSGHSWHKTSQSHTPRSHYNTRDSVMHYEQSLYTLFSCFRRPTRRCCRTSLLRIKARYSTFLGRYPGPYPGWSRMFRL